MNSMTTRQLVILLALFIGTSFTFIMLDNRTALNPLQTGLRSLVNPITTRLNPEPVEQVPESEWERRYQELEATHTALEADYQRTQAIADRVTELEQMLNLQESNPNIQVMPARVIGTDPTSTQKMIIIDVGATDGIRKGMVVTDPNYFVGYVTEVEDRQSQVVLAIDSTVTIGAELESSKATGVVQGLWQSGGRMELRYVDRNIEPQQNELVVTTCNPDVRTANVTCGLIIGKVSGEPLRDNQGDSQTVQLIPAADFDNLSLVAVIVSDEGTAGAP